MSRRLRRILLIPISLLLVGIAGLAVVNWRGAAKLNHSFDADKLTDDDRRQLTETARLKHIFGEEVWPDFAAADIPIILYNDRYEFLIGANELPVGWEAVGGDDFQGAPYCKRKKEHSEAFAVKIDDAWAGSIGSRELMSRDFVLHARKELPPVLSQLVPYWFFVFDEGFHAALVLHESFHAFQAVKSPVRFAEAKMVYALEKDYSFNNPQFAEAWNREGTLFSSALHKKDLDKARSETAEFLKTRKTRRARFDPNNELARFEQELEWLEGLAKYAEIRFYEAAANGKEKSSIAVYDPGLRRWEDEFITHVTRQQKK